MNENSSPLKDNHSAAAAKLPELLRWDEEAMTTGVASIDEQHRELIAKINELYRIHQAGATVEDIKVILKYLGNFAKKHFQEEEELMEKFKCPTRSTNCSAHARFLQDYQELVSNFSIEQDADQTASEIERMAARWLVSHICRVDIGLREIPKP
jgi:hemerythrin